MEGNEAYLYLRSGLPVIVEKGAELPNCGFGITHGDIPFSDDMRWVNIDPHKTGTIQELIDYLETDELISYIRRGSPSVGWNNGQDVIVWIFEKDKKPYSLNYRKQQTRNP